MAPPSDQTLEWEGALADLVAPLQASALPVRIEVIAPGPMGSCAGEVHLIAGGLADAFAGSLRRDDAMAALGRVEGARFLVECRLPDPESGTLAEAGPDKGSLKDRPLAALMRYCEDYVLTCRVEIEQGQERGTVSYKRGELAGTTIDGQEADDRLPDMLAWSDGSYRIVLPVPALPPGRRRDGQPAPRPADAAKPERKRHPTLPTLAGAAGRPEPAKAADASIAAPQKAPSVPPVSSLRLSPSPDAAPGARPPTQVPFPPEVTKRGIPSVSPLAPAAATARPAPGAAPSTAAVPPPEPRPGPAPAPASGAGKPMVPAATPGFPKPAAPPPAVAKAPSGASTDPATAARPPAAPAAGPLKPAPAPAAAGPPKPAPAPAAAGPPKPAPAPAAASPPKPAAAPAAAGPLKPAAAPAAAGPPKPAPAPAAASPPKPAAAPAAASPPKPAAAPAAPTTQRLAAVAAAPAAAPTTQKPAAAAAAPKPAAPAAAGPATQKLAAPAAAPAAAATQKLVAPAAAPAAGSATQKLAAPAARPAPPPAPSAKPAADLPPAAPPEPAAAVPRKPETVSRIGVPPRDGGKPAASNDLKPTSGTIDAKPRPVVRPRVATSPVEVEPEPPQQRPATPTPLVQALPPPRLRTSARKKPPERPVRVYALMGLAIGVGIVLAYWLYFTVHVGR
jgi:hypothetical protein